MIKASDITAVVPCLFEDEAPIWMMRESANRFGVSLKPYGIGSTYAGWIDIKVRRLREEALACPTSHILYSDARDAWFLAGPDEIADKYNAMDCPPLLLSAQCDVFRSYRDWYDRFTWDTTKKFPYIGTPGQLCEAKALADALGWMQERYYVGGVYDPKGLPDDDPPWWIEYMIAHPGEVKLDHECAIFMNAGSHLDEGMWDTVLEVRDGRVFNRFTEQRPCVLHFNGGYSHALHGKWESLEKHWQSLGYTSRPPWEGAQ